jgi:enolase
MSLVTGSEVLDLRADPTVEVEVILSTSGMRPGCLEETVGLVPSKPSAHGI